MLQLKFGPRTSYVAPAPAPGNDEGGDGDSRGREGSGQINPSKDDAGNEEAPDILGILALQSAIWFIK